MIGRSFDTLAIEGLCPKGVKVYICGSMNQRFGSISVRFGVCVLADFCVEFVYGSVREKKRTASRSMMSRLVDFSEVSLN